MLTDGNGRIREAKETVLQHLFICVLFPFLLCVFLHKDLLFAFVKAFVQAMAKTSTQIPLDVSSMPQQDVWNTEDDENFSDLDQLQFFKVYGKDKSGRRILRIVGRYFPAAAVSRARLTKFVHQKILAEIPEGPFCVVYIHTSVQRVENCPGLSTLWLIYEDLPPSIKERLQIVYFLHPGIQSRLLFATVGRFFLSAGLYWKLKYINRLEFLWDHIRKGQIEIPDFVYDHDDELEERPLMDYGLEADPLYAYDMATVGSANSRYSLRWASETTL